MSDPVSNAEVEDVLASIRRLVSEENRSTAPDRARPNRSEPSEPSLFTDPQTTSSEQDSDAREAGKLVLTPSLRVMTPSEPSEPEADDSEDEETATSDAVGVEEAIPEAWDDATDETPDEEPVTDDELRATENARTAAALVVGLKSTPEDDKTARVAERSEWPVEEDAQTQTALSEADVFGPNQPEEQAGAEEPAEEDAPSDLQDTLSAAVSVANPDRIADDARSNPKGLSAKIAALEAAVGRRRDDEWEPDGVTADEPFSGTEPPALAWEDHIAEDADDVETMPDPVSHMPVRPPSETASDAWPPQDTEAQERPDLTEEPALLDEEALHDMVAEIVRQELQGALGERITRNVRKLVRREIQRALAAHDLD